MPRLIYLWECDRCADPFNNDETETSNEWALGWRKNVIVEDEQAIYGEVCPSCIEELGTKWSVQDA